MNDCSSQEGHATIDVGIIPACSASKKTLSLNSCDLRESADCQRKERSAISNTVFVEDTQRKLVQTRRRDAQPGVSKDMDNTTARIVVGYALTSKKTKSFLKPKLVVLAREKGIGFVAIDRNQPLQGQGPFDVILHKISGREWLSQLEVSNARAVTVLLPSLQR